MSVTREQIDQELDRFGELTNEQLVDTYYVVAGPVIAAARLGRILTQSQCPTCGGSGKTPFFRQPPTDPCPSCDGSGKEKPEFLLITPKNAQQAAFNAVMTFMRMDELDMDEQAYGTEFANAILDALAALAEGD